MLRQMDTICIEKVEDLTNELILKLIRMHKTHAVPRLTKLQNYYEGYQDILHRRFADASKPNNKIVNNYCRYITNIINGYFMGTPIRYKSLDETALMYYQDVMNANDEQYENTLISRNMSIFGQAYELMYMGEDSSIKFTVLDNKEVIPIYSTTVNPSPIAFIRYYTIKSYIDGVDDIEKVEVYTKDETTYYTYIGGVLRFNDVQPTFFGQPPIIVFENNLEEQGDFEGIMSIQDAYNMAISDRVNDAEYMADSYLVITGCEADDDTFSSMRTNRLILLPDGGSVQFLAKTTDNATIESFADRLQKDIHKFAGVPDLTNNDISNVSGVALKFKFEAMEEIAKGKERLFKKGLARRQEMIFNILNIRGLNFESTDIEAVFQRTLPTDEDAIVNTVKQLYGIVSKDTLLSQLPFIEDSALELEKIEQEQADPYADSIFNQSNGLEAFGE